MAKQLNITLALDIRPASEAVKSFISIAQAGGTQIKAALAGQLPAPNLSVIDQEIKQLDITVDEYLSRILQASQAVQQETQAEEQLGQALDQVKKKRVESRTEVDKTVVSYDSLQAQLAEVQTQLRQAPVGSDQFKALSIDAARLEIQLRQTQEAQLAYSRSAGISGMGTGDARQAIIALNYTLRDSPYLFQNVAMGVMAISNNVPMLVDGLAAVRQASGTAGGGVRLLLAQLRGVMGISVGFSLLMALFQAYSFSAMGAKDSTDELGESAKKTKKELQEMREELERFRASGQKAIEIEITLQADIEQQLKDFREELTSLEGSRSQALGIEPAPIKPETVARIEFLRTRIAELEKQTVQTEAYKNFERTINSIGDTASRVTTEGMADLIVANRFTEAQVEATIKTLREAREQLIVNSQAYRDNVKAVETLEGALSKLRKTQTQTFEEKTGEALTKIQAQVSLRDITPAEALEQLRKIKDQIETQSLDPSKKIQLRLQVEAAIGSVRTGEFEKVERTLQNRLQLGQINTAQAIEGLEELRKKIQETKDLTPDQKLTLEVQVQGAIDGLRQTETEVRQSLAQIQAETIRSTEERELASLDLRYRVERERIAQTYKDKAVVSSLTKALDTQEAFDRGELEKEHGRRRRETELQIAEIRIQSLMNEQDRELALIDNSARQRKLQIEAEVEDENLKSQYLEALEMDRLARIRRVQFAYVYDLIQSADQAVGAATSAFFSELIFGGDSEEDFELQMLEFRKQEEAIRKDKNMSDQEREMRLRALARQRHEYEMRNAQTLGGRIRNALVGAARSFGQALVEAVNRMVAEMIAKEIIMFLMRKAGFSAIPEGTAVNNPNDVGLPMAAEGAIVTKRTVMVVGEAGPEIVIPQKYVSGRIEDLPLPKLASGGIVDRPTVAVIGEAGPEAVVPMRFLTPSKPSVQVQRTEVDVNVTGELIGSGLELRALLKRVEKLEGKYH